MYKDVYVEKICKRNLKRTIIVMGRVAAINIGLIQIDQAGFSSFFTYLMIFQSGGMLFEKSSTPYGASKI